MAVKRNNGGKRANGVQTLVQWINKGIGSVGYLNGLGPVSSVSDCLSIPFYLVIEE